MTENDIEIRYAVPEDAAICGAIHSVALCTGFRGLVPDEFMRDRFSPERRRERFYQELQAGTPKTAILYKNAQPAGLISIGPCRHTKEEPGLIEIWRVYVHPEYWRQGLGTMLLRWGIGEIRKMGYRKAELWTFAENHRARSCYEKFGFRHDGTEFVDNYSKDILEVRYVMDIAPDSGND
jgi:ribosomal protein S18 acetylase RimI-like enzyme